VHVHGRRRHALLAGLSRRARQHLAAATRPRLLASAGADPAGGLPLLAANAVARHADTGWADDELGLHERAGAERPGVPVHLPARRAWIGGSTGGAVRHSRRLHAALRPLSRARAGLSLVQSEGAGELATPDGLVCPLGQE